MKAERTKWAWLSAIAVAVLLIATVILIRLGQQPPAHALYFAANYDAWWIRPLFSITPLPNGYRVESQQFDCRTTAADTKTKRQPFTTAVKAEFRCDEHLLELREKGDTPILTSTGFTDLTAPFVVGSGYPVSAQRDEAPRFVYRAPGVAARHLIAFPSAECGGSPAADAALCAENGGATGSMLLYPVNGDATRLQHGERITVANNDVLWLGYVPFRVTSDDGKITLRVVLTEDRKSWRTMGGERLWQGLELPSWNLTARDPAVPSGTNVFYPEAARFSKGHLTAERYEPEQEEQLQLLVDHELLCLESASGALNDARVVWRPPHDPGCVDYGLTTPVRTRRMPPPDTVLRTYQQVQSEDRFGELMTQSTANLRDRVWELDPTSNLFVFDFGFTATPPGPDGRSDLERVPTALLGVRPRITTTRLRKPEATFRRPIAFRASSTSPALDLEAAGPRRLLLMLSNPVGPSGTSAPMHVCLSPAGGTLQDPAPGSIALGNVALQGDGVWWAAAGSAAGNDCVELIRRAADVTARSLGGVAASRHPRDGSAEVAIGATATPLIDGDSVGIGTMRFRYTAANDLAAFSLRGGGRVYPFGADGVTLLGIGSVSNGVEGAMALEMRTELYRDAQRRRRAGQAEEPLRLTIDGDMQRLVSRELNEAFRENAPAAALRGLRAAAVVLDADTGGVLAVANAPRFDPWDTTNPTDSELLLSAMRGQVTDDDTFRSRIQNWAFLRHLAVGSTMKVATSIAMQREGIRLSDQDDASGEGCHHLLTIRLAGGRRVDDFKCTHDNPVLANGAPSPAHWLPAFYGSCNVYFGGAAAMLVPELGTSIFSAGPTATIPASFDPAALRPLDLEPVNRSGGNGFFETLLLLGYRFDFHDARNAPPQQVTRYRQLQYPTIREPWLAGLEVENAFAYPTVPAPERFTNTFRGGEPQLNVPGLEIDGKAEYKPQWKSQDWMPHYMALGWGQIMEGSALSIAVSGIPALNSLGQIRTPQIFASRVAPLDPRRPALLNNEQQLVLQKGFKEVIANAAGTAHAALLDTRNAAERMGYQIGGKTGTIQLEKPPTQTGHADVASRARWWGCGVRGFAFDDGDWQKLLSIVSGTKAAAIADAYPTLPPRGFAAQAAECDGLNPGMPRVAGALPNGVADAWRELQSLEWRAVPDRENNSSAFLAAIWPNPVQPPANPAAAPPRTGNRRLILGITFDLNSAGSKAATRRIARELVRLMAARGE